MRKIDRDVYEAVKDWKDFIRTGAEKTEVRVVKGIKNKNWDSVSRVLLFLNDNLIWWMNVNETQRTMQVNADWSGYATQTTVSLMKAAFAATHLNVTVELNNGEIEFSENGKPVQKNCYDSEWICSACR